MKPEFRPFFAFNPLITLRACAAAKRGVVLNNAGPHPILFDESACVQVLIPRVRPRWARELGRRYEARSSRSGQNLAPVHASDRISGPLFKVARVALPQSAREPLRA